MNIKINIMENMKECKCECAVNEQGNQVCKCPGDCCKESNCNCDCNSEKDKTCC